MNTIAIKETVSELYRSTARQVTQNYRYLHSHPELSFLEKTTAAYLMKELSAENIPFRYGIGGHGILARIEGSKDNGPVIGLRADMDALPIQEENPLPYSSVVPGVMHACGHDAHMACLLGAARILNRLKKDLKGTVLLIFQPGEEKHPGGASLMLRDGIFDEYTPCMLMALHVNATIPSGKVAFGKGTVMASADEFHIRIKGRGGHGALPHKLNDTVLAAAQTVVSLQQMVSRRSDPFLPTVLTIGRFIADGATNIIPGTVQLSGTLRCMNENERRVLKEEIKNTVAHTALAYGCTGETILYDGYPAVVNNPEITEKAAGFAAEWLGPDNILPMEKRMTAEDFGFFSAHIPSTFFRLGIRGNENADCGDQHTSTFRIDENALATGTQLLTYLAFRFLESR